MLLRRIPIFVAIGLLAVLAANATDFWLTKDWKQWSKYECSLLLSESPWAHTSKPGLAFNSDSPGEMTARGDQLTYVVQIRSSLPLRQALVRQQQIDQNYGRMSADQRTAFDVKTEQILGRNYDDSILVHVDFSAIGNSAPIGMQIREPFRNPESLRALLVAEDGFKLSPTRVDASYRDASFNAIFPRMVNGSPAIKHGQKRFAIQFLNPSHQTVRVEFDLSKMLVSGKPSY